MSFHLVLDLPSGVPGISLVPPHTAAIEIREDSSHVPEGCLTLGRTSLVPLPSSSTAQVPRVALARQPLNRPTLVAAQSVITGAVV